MEEVSKKKGFSSKPAEWLFLFVINAGQGVRHGQAYDCPPCRFDCKQLERGSWAALFQIQYGQNNEEIRVDCRSETKRIKNQAV